RLSPSSSFPPPSLSLPAATTQPVSPGDLGRRVQAAVATTGRGIAGRHGVELAADPWPASAGWCRRRIHGGPTRGEGRPAWGGAGSGSMAGRRKASGNRGGGGVGDGSMAGSICTSAASMAGSDDALTLGIRESAAIHVSTARIGAWGDNALLQQVRGGRLLLSSRMKQQRRCAGPLPATHTPICHKGRTSISSSTDRYLHVPICPLVH
ncbi:unnamed protein product, partial [Urochloa humidicola]